MYVPSAGEVAAVVTLSLGLEIGLDEVDGHVQEEVEVGPGEVEIAVLRIDDPFPKGLGLLFGGEFGALVCDVGIYVAVEEDRTAFLESLPYPRTGPVPVLGEEEGHQLGMHRLVGAEVPSEETADEVPVDGCPVAGEMDVLEAAADGLEIGSQSPDLRGFARAVKSFQYNKHISRVYRYKDIQKIHIFVRKCIS